MLATSRQVCSGGKRVADGETKLKQVSEGGGGNSAIILAANFEEGKALSCGITVG